MKSATKVTTVAVPSDAYQHMKTQAAARGMKIREYSRYLIKLVEVAPPDVHTRTYEAFMQDRLNATTSPAPR